MYIFGSFNKNKKYQDSTAKLSFETRAAAGGFGALGKTIVRRPPLFLTSTPSWGPGGGDMSPEVLH